MLSELLVPKERLRTISERGFYHDEQQKRKRKTGRINQRL